MPTKHCEKCNPGAPCGNGHLYVLELGLGIEEHFANQPTMGYVYVGSTSHSVEQRFLNNLTRQDLAVVSMQEAREIGEDGQWRWNTPGIKKIRAHFVRYRPDLFYKKHNPIVWDGADPGKLQRWEGNIAEKLSNRGWKVFCDQR